MTVKNTYIKIKWKKELRGELVKELEPDEYGTWVRLRLLCGECPYQPYIQIKTNLGFTDYQLAEQLSIKKKLWMRTKDKLLHYNKITIGKGNVIRIMRWKNYIGTKTMQGLYSDGRMPELHDPPHASEEAKELYELRRRVITYLNDKAGKSYKVSSMPSLRYINARRREGAKLEDFKHVIDVKVPQWMGTDYERFLRPETLFSNSKFWGYVNEPKPKIKLSEEQRMDKQRDPYWAFTPEEKKKIPKIKKEYKEKLKETMREEGWTTEEEIDFMKVPTETDFIKNALREVRK